MSFFDHPENLSRPNSYFAALNSHRGFVSYFPELFTPYRKYVIKGGPGSGKSTLMKKLACAAEKRGLTAERYYCSSDTDSLDAVAIPALGFVVLDGTPPHTTEPECPGAVDAIVDMTAFWNASLLEERSQTIGLLNRQISAIYRRCYALMKGIYGIETAVTLSTESMFEASRAEKIVNRLLDKYRVDQGDGPTTLLRPTTAFGVKGYVSLNSYESAASTVIYIKDRAIFSEHFFSILQKALIARKIPHVVAPRPLDEKTEAILLPENGLLFTRKHCEDICHGVINLDRMLPERGRKATAGQKELLRKIDDLCLMVKEELFRIGILHDELETHYIAATDYTALNQFTENFIEKRLSNA